MRPSKYKFHLLEKNGIASIIGANLQNVRNRANVFGKRYGVVIICDEYSKGVLIKRVR